MSNTNLKSQLGLEDLTLSQIPIIGSSIFKENIHYEISLLLDGESPKSRLSKVHIPIEDNESTPKNDKIHLEMPVSYPLSSNIDIERKSPHFMKKNQKEIINQSSLKLNIFEEDFLSKLFDEAFSKIVETDIKCEHCLHNSCNIYISEKATNTITNQQFSQKKENHVMLHDDCLTNPCYNCITSKRYATAPNPEQVLILAYKKCLNCQNIKFIKNYIPKQDRERSERFSYLLKNLQMKNQIQDQISIIKKHKIQIKIDDVIIKDIITYLRDKLKTIRKANIGLNVIKV